MRSSAFRWTAPAANDSLRCPPVPESRSRGLSIMFNTLQWLLEEIRADAVVHTRSLPPGLERLWKATAALLDASLRRPAVQVLITALHGHEGALQLQQRSVDVLRSMVLTDLQFQGAALADSQARLFSALILEAQRVENEKRRVLPEYRELLQRYLWTLRV